jgi:hypothetical protein
MRRRKDGRWDWRDQNRRSLEASYASWVVDKLELEGHAIDDVWSPDYERSRRPEMATRPDLAMTIDGEQAGLDITMFTTFVASWAAGRGAAIRQVIETRLMALDDARSILGAVSYDRAGLLKLSRRRLLEETDSLADAFVASVRSSHGPAGRVDLEVPLAWVRAAGMTLSHVRGQRRSVYIDVRSPRGDVATQVDAFILECVEKKGSQLAPWGRGILAIAHGPRETADDVRAGFNRSGRCPWWRVYWCGPSPELVHLVAAGE